MLLSIVAWGFAEPALSSSGFLLYALFTAFAIWGCCAFIRLGWIGLRTGDFSGLKGPAALFLSAAAIIPLIFSFIWPSSENPPRSNPTELPNGFAFDNETRGLYPPLNTQRPGQVRDVRIVDPKDAAEMERAYRLKRIDENLQDISGELKRRGQVPQRVELYDGRGDKVGSATIR
jgi:hypothetical protein